MILFAAYKGEEYQLYCGVARADGEILAIDEVNSFSGASLFTNGEGIKPPRYCPPGSKINSWAPDMQRYVFYMYSNPEKMYQLYLGKPGAFSIKSLQTFRKTDDQSQVSNPGIHWMGSESIYYFDDELEVTHFIDLSERAATIFNHQVTSANPAGTTFSYLDGETLFVMDVGGIEPVNVDQAAVEQGIRLFLINKKIGIRWAPDGEKFAMLVEQDGSNTVAIFDKAGTFVTTIGDENRAYRIDYNWAPDSQHILVNCHIKRVGQSGTSDLCLYALSGELLAEYPWQAHRVGAGNFSTDGRFIYTLVSEKPPALGANNFRASLTRIDIASGEVTLLGENMNDLSWINSGDFWEIYSNNYDNASAVSESPDGKYMLLNDTGNFFKRGAEPYTENMVFAVLCSQSEPCQDLQFGDYKVIGAGWWNPPVDWKPGR